MCSRYLRAQLTAQSRPLRCDKPLDVPLPRSGQGLIEIVDIEDDAAFRRGKSAEVEEVAITARLHRQSGGWRSRQVGGHHTCGPAIEGKGRLEHPAVANGDELLHPA